MSDPRSKFLSLLDKVIEGGGDFSKDAGDVKEVFKAWAQTQATTTSGAVSDANKAREDLEAMTGKFTELEKTANTAGANNPDVSKITAQVGALTEALATEKAARIDAEEKKSMSDVKNFYSNNLNINPKVKAPLIDNLVNSGQVIEQGGQFGVLVDSIFTPQADHVKMLEAEYKDFLTPAKGPNPPAPHADGGGTGDKYAGMNYLQIMDAQAKETPAK